MKTREQIAAIQKDLEAKGVRYCIGPSGIGARRSPLGKQPESDGSVRVALARDDPRRKGRFGAAWTLGYVAQLATIPSVEAITLMSLTGPCGIVCLEERHAFRPYPAFHVLQRLTGSPQACRISISDPVRVAALAMVRNGARELLVANLTGDAVDVRLRGWSSMRIVETLLDDGTSASGADVAPPSQKAAIHALHLDAYEVVVVR